KRELVLASRSFFSFGIKIPNYTPNRAENHFRRSFRAANARWRRSEKRIAQCSLLCSMFDFDLAVAVLELLLPCLISRREEAGRERLSEMKVTGREEARRERLSEMMYGEREVETIVIV
ncbi:hypothetical protein Dimus_000466, partial [Dionaea muscipula]